MKHFLTQAELTNAVVVATTTFPSLLLGLVGVAWLLVGRLVSVALRVIGKAVDLYHPVPAPPSTTMKTFTDEDEHAAP